jgi:hypothetical protein
MTTVTLIELILCFHVLEFVISVSLLRVIYVYVSICKIKESLSEQMLTEVTYTVNLLM